MSHTETPIRSPRQGALQRAVALQLIAATGDSLAGVALALRVYEQTHAAWAVTAVMLGVVLPVVLLAPLSGLILDRVKLSPVLAVTALGMAGAVTTLGFVHGLGADFAVVIAYGIGDSLMRPGIASAVPELATPTGVTRANGYLTTATFAGQTLGPLLAGVVTGLGGFHLAFWVDGGAYVVASAGLLSLKLGRRHAGEAAFTPGMAGDEGAQENAHGHESTLRQLSAGLRFLWSDPLLRMLLGVVAMMVAFASLSLVAELFLAESVLRAGTGGYAALLAAWTAGMATGTLLGGRLAEHRLVAATLIGTVVTGLGIAAAAVAPVLWVALVAYAIGGLGNGFEVVSLRSLLNARSPAAVQGRVFALYTAAIMGAMSLGTAAAAVLVGSLGPRGALSLAGWVGAAAGVYGCVRRRSIERHGEAPAPRSEVPAPVPMGAGRVLETAAAAEYEVDEELAERVLVSTGGALEVEAA
jgi:MFS family permease